MPNWCCGALRIDGTYDNVKAFIRDGLRIANAPGDRDEAYPPRHTDWFFREVHESGLEFGFEIYSNPKGDLYMDNTHRLFLGGLLDPATGEYLTDRWLTVEKPPNASDTVIIRFNDCEAAWQFRAEELAVICSNFHVGFYITAEEPGVGFDQAIQITRNGTVLMDITRDWPNGEPPDDDDWDLGDSPAATWVDNTATSAPFERRLLPVIPELFDMRLNPAIAEAVRVPVGTLITDHVTTDHVITDHVTTDHITRDAIVASVPAGYKTTFKDNDMIVVDESEDDLKK